MNLSAMTAAGDLRNSGDICFVRKDKNEIAFRKGDIKNFLAALKALKYQPGSESYRNMVIRAIQMGFISAEQYLREVNQ